MSKQYLTTHTVDDAHITTIFSLAVTPSSLFSASGASALHIHDTTDPSYPVIQSLDQAHKLGCHHVATSKYSSGRVAASAGFGGEVHIWQRSDGGVWEKRSSLHDGEAWALALSADEQYLACTTHDGRIIVWDLVDELKVQTYDTAGGGSGTYGMSVDLSRDGRLTASGHESGSVYVFNNDTGRMVFSLSGLAKPIRAVAFSPLGTRLAAAGDAGVIAIYDMQHGEHVGNLSPGASAAWITSLDFSDTGEYLLAGSMDGKVRVWSIDRQTCVATHSETDKPLWSVRWLPKTARSGDAFRGERFCTGGANKSISFYREATGG